MSFDKWREFRNGFLLALAYIVSGKLALMLALPPGYASPIFPPAGIAVAFALIGGKRTLPWILLGSELLNLWVGYESSHAMTAAGVTAASVIALASTLQAAAGGWAFRRYIGYPSALDNVKDVVTVLILSPLVCLVSASLSVAGLVAMGAFKASNFSTNWFTWWIGDTLGLIVLVPIMLALFGQPRSMWHRRKYTIVMPMLTAFSIVVVVFIQASKWEYEQSMAEFSNRAQQLADNIQARLKEQEYFLETVAAILFHDRSKPVTREKFERALKKLLTIYPMVHAIEWAPRVTRAQRSAFEAAQKAHFPDYRIVEPGADGRPEAAGDRPYYYPVTYLDPIAPNRAAVGLDLASTPDRRAALNSTLALGVPVATTPFRLVQETGHQAGILLMLRDAESARTPGVVLTVLRAGDFIGSALPGDTSAFRIRLSDEAARQVIFSRQDGEAAHTAFERNLKFGSRLYRLQLEPSPLYLAQHRSWQSWIVLVVELLFTGLLGAFLLLGTGYAARMETQVIERTRSLSASRDELNNAQRLAMIGSWTNHLKQGVIAWSDEIFRILELDPKTSVPSYESFLSATHPDDRAIVDRVYRESVTNHKASDLVHRLLFGDGRVKFVRVRYETLNDDTGEPVLTRGTVQDITRIKVAEEALRVSEERWKFALEGAGDGLWDWNIQTGELYLSKQELTVLGYAGESSAQAHIDEWVARQHPDDRVVRQAALDKYLEGEAPLYTCEFRTQARDGGWRWILARGMVVSRSSDGKPLRMIGTHSDITERKRMESKLIYMATTDSLTGASNRRHFLEQVELELERVKRHTNTASLLMLDIDRFKRINDVYGHAVGDDVLRHFAELTGQRLRHIDQFGRLGGEEFGVLLPGTDREGAKEFGLQLLHTVANMPVQSDKGEIHITVSIGVTTFDPGDDTPAGILTRADAALYRAKQAGRNRLEAE